MLNRQPIGPQSISKRQIHQLAAPDVRSYKIATQLQGGASATEKGVYVVDAVNYGTNLTLSGEQTVDGVALTDGMICLPAGQTTGANRRPYIVRTGAWEVVSDSLDKWRVVKARYGTSNSGLWELTNATTVTLGTTALTWERVPHAQLTAGMLPYALSSGVLRDSRLQMNDGSNDAVIGLTYSNSLDSGVVTSLLYVGGDLGANPSDVVGIIGVSSTAFGVYGASEESVGVSGWSENNIGVFAESTNGTPLYVRLSGNNISGQDLGYFANTGSNFSGNGVRAVITSSGHGVKVLQQGTGKGGEFTISNASNSTHAVDATTTGTGFAIKGYTEGTNSAGYFQINNSSSAAAALEATTNGTGHAFTATRNVATGTNAVANIAQSHASSEAAGVLVTQAGTGYGLRVSQTGGNGPNSNAIYAIISTSSNQSACIYAQTNGIGPGVNGWNTSSGNGLQGDNNSTGNGVQGNAGSGSGNGVAGRGGTGNAIYGLNSSTGRAGRFTRNSSTGVGSAVLVEALSTSDTQTAFEVTHAGNGTLISASFSSNNVTADMVYLTHSGSSFSGNGFRASITSSGHGVKSLQQGTGKAGEFTISNSSNTNVALDAGTDGSGIVIKGVTTGAGRVFYGESQSAAPSDPLMELKSTNTGHNKAILKVNQKGTGNIFEAWDDATEVFRISDGGISHVMGGVTGKRVAVTGATHTIVAASVIIGVSPPTGGTTLTLPAANQDGQILIIKDEGAIAGTRTITISRAGSDTIEGATSTTITVNSGYVMLCSDGAGTWYVIG
ncbi:MAG: hypothetical protein JNJ94_12625 [Chlorobi bacterium]|nr:hypothetical protein [Chlorobiota bacterium]